MATPLVVPQLGNEITEAEVSEWLKSDGDHVEAEELVVVITTTKASVELEAPASGTLTVLLDEGEIVEVGATLASIT